MKHVNLPLPEDLHKRLKLHCVQIDTKMTELLRKVVEEYLDKAEKRKSK
jgi:hypothetical protein